MAFLNSYIGIGLPSQIRTNKDLEKLFPEWSAEKIFEKIGIEKRVICNQEENSLSLSKLAFKNLYEGFDEEILIDLVIYVSNSSQNQAPGDGHLFMSSFKGLSNAGCIDINLGCSGYTYALGISSSLVDSNMANNVLIITTDAYSKYITEKDKSNMSLFGDAASASIVSKLPITDRYWKLSNFKYGSNGDGYDDLKISSKESDKILTMNGPNIFSFTANEVVNFIKDQNINLSNKKIIFHQANAFMLNYMRQKLGILKENFIVSFKNYGNTVSTSIPLAIHDNITELSKEDLFLCGFGIGASYSSINLECKSS